MLAIALAFLLLAVAPSLPVRAAEICRQMGDREVCVLEIERSAKYYWRYRAQVSVDGRSRPTEVYDCRRRLRIQRDKTTVPFARDGAGELICGLLN